MDNNRISIAAIGTVAQEEPIYLQIGDATIEVRRRISYEEILNMMQWCIDMIVGEKPFMSAPLNRIVKDFAILNAYTNLDLGVTHSYEEMSDIYAEYDIIQAFGVMSNVLEKIDKEQVSFFETTLDVTLESILAYRNSAKGIVDALAIDADTDSARMEKAMTFLQNSEQQEKVKTILEAAKAIQG